MFIEERDNMLPLSVSIRGASELTSLSETKLDQAIRAGTLPVRHHGNRMLIRVTDLQKFVDNLPEGRPDAPPQLEGRRIGRPRKEGKA